jgi:pantothenate kinase type III
MILVIDIGNSTCKFGLFDKNEIVAVWKAVTRDQKNQ